MQTYTDIYKTFQIRDICYVGDPPKDSPIMFDVVQWMTHEPYEVVDGKTGEKRMSDRHCWSVAHLVYDPKEPCFELVSVGLRWLEVHPDKDVEDWIMKWCDYKLHELYTNEEEI